MSTTNAQPHNIVFAIRIPGGHTDRYNVAVFGYIHVDLTRDEAAKVCGDYLCKGKELVAANDFTREAYMEAHFIVAPNDRNGSECYFCGNGWDRLVDLGEDGHGIYLHNRIPMCKHCEADAQEKGMVKA